MENNEKVIEMKEVTENAQETVVETKPKFKAKAKDWWKRNKKKILIAVGAAAAVGGMAAAKMIKDRKDDAAAKYEAEQAQLAEDWYNRGLLEARSAAETESEPETVDVEYTPVDEV